MLHLHAAGELRMSLAAGGRAAGCRAGAGESLTVVAPAAPVVAGCALGAGLGRPGPARAALAGAGALTVGLGAIVT